MSQKANLKERALLHSCSQNVYDVTYENNLHFQATKNEDFT